MLEQVATYEEIERSWSYERLCVANMALDYYAEIKRLASEPEPKGRR